MQLFITGTDTDAGKTHVTQMLLEALKSRGERAAGVKPFCCGGRQDSHLLHQASAEGLTLDEINPVWLKTPASPYAAALIENRTLDFTALQDACKQLATKVDHLLVEGVGGWEVPLTPHYTSADFAEELGLPVLLVVNNKLGALNHTLLTVKNILARGLSCMGIVLNYAVAERDVSSISNRMILENMCDVPVIGEVMHGETDGADLLDALLAAS